MMQILGKLTKIRQSIDSARAQLSGIEVHGEAAGGMIRVTATADQRIKAIKIDPGIFDSGLQEMLEDLLLASLNQALEAATAKSEEHMQRAMGSFLPPGTDLSQLFR